MRRAPIIALTAVLLLLTLAASGVWTWALILSALLLSVACAAVLAHTRATTPGLSRRPTAIETAYLVLLLFLLLSVIPLPHSRWRLTGARRHAQDEQVVLALQQAPTVGVSVPTVLQADSGTRPPSFSLSRNRAGSWRAVILAIALFPAAILASFFSAPHRRGFLRLLVFLGGCLAAAGIVSFAFYPQGSTLWWIFPLPPALPGPVAGFVNPNHFAGFLAILIPAALWIGTDDLLSQRWTRATLASLCLLLMIGAVFLSHSLGAALAAAAGLLACLVPPTLRHRRTIPAAILLLLSAVLLTLVAAQHPAVRERLRRAQRHNDRESLIARAQAWRSAWAAWQAYPVLGVGPNAFRMVHPQHRVTSESAHMTHPENEYLQVLAETGVAGVTLVAALGLALVIQIRRSGCSAPVDSVLRAACVGALAAAAIHAASDFALHVPLYAVTLAAMLGILLAPTSAGPPPPRYLPARTPWAPLAGLAVLATISVAAAPIEQRDSPAHILRANDAELARALLWAPTSWHAWYYLGRRACLVNTSESCAFGERCLSRAAAYDPNNYRLWRELGMLRMKLGNMEGARAAFDRVRALRDWVKLPSLPETGP